MSQFKRSFVAALVIAGFVVSAPIAEAAALAVTLGTRETGDGGGIVPTGGNAGFSGGIEWVNLDGQTVELDGAWHMLAWDMDVDPITGFAGATADGVLDGTAGSIEHLRLLNVDGITSPITLWIDLIVNTIDVLNIPSDVTVEDFEGNAVGDEVMFQEPTFSGSTDVNIVNPGPPDSSLVTDDMSFEGVQSLKVEFQFVDGDPSRWLRLTTFNTPNRPNPLIRYDQNSIVSLKIKGTLLASDGDFDGDGFVNGADFLKWQRGESPNPLSPEDLAAWEANYGTTLSPLPVATALPEPTTCGLVFAASLVLAIGRRHSQ